MPLPTPFHPRTSALCTSLSWKEWAGYHAVCRYDTSHEPEYHAVRNAAGLLDVSPLHKIAVGGPGATDFLAAVGGTMWAWIGGTVSPAGNQAPGAYQATITLDVVYTGN